ncbi:MAG: tetratricopeptide repeat protein [Pseudomonadota bacterium]
MTVPMAGNISSILRPAVWVVSLTLIAAFGVVSFQPTSVEADAKVWPLRSLSGSYLAGRFARSDHDTESAARFYRSALFRDPGRPVLIEQSFLMEASEGNWQDAERLAEKLIEVQPDHRMGQMFLGIAAFKKAEYGAAENHFLKADTGPIGQLTSAIARSWIALAKEQDKRALRLLRLPRQADWAQFYLRYHRGLVADLAGQRQQAKTAFNQVFRQDSRTLRTALAYAHHLAHANKRKAAISVLNSHLKRTSGDGHPLAVDLLERLRGKQKVGLLIETPAQGLAEVFYGLGEALTGEGGVSIGLLYLQMALYLEPKHPFALAALANAHETTKRYDAAIDVYRRIPSGTPLTAAIEIRKAFNLNSLGDVEGAKELLEKTAARNPEDIKPLDALGNIMRSKKRYDEAIAFYSRAIDLIEKPTREHWSYFYSRGTCYERVKDWPKAEKDLQKALELFPDQPLALNYLGYSWIDQNINLKQGLKLIEKAVALRPDDGYIVDSLGWAHFKLSDYNKAVRYLERAVELRSEDPILNDHLGDALWRVGRKREARFQWDLSLSLNPEPEELIKIKKKLASGLPEKLQARATTLGEGVRIGATDGTEKDGAGGSAGAASSVDPAAAKDEAVPLPTRSQR